MGERRGTKALELWCRRITDGYPGVNVQNMTTSWRDGLAFCAMIHHFRPDLIDFGSLDKNDIYGNNELAFRTAEQHLGIPALLDAEDMASCSVPDRLSILTYLSQFYQTFGSSSPSRMATNRTVAANEEPRITSVPESPKAKMEREPMKQRGLGRLRREPCAVCGNPVFLAERLVIAHKLYHRTCFRCARCDHQLTIGNYYETETAQFCCETCPDEEAKEALRKLGPPAPTGPKFQRTSLSDEEKSELDSIHRNNLAVAAAQRRPVEDHSKTKQMRLDYLTNHMLLDLEHRKSDENEEKEEAPGPVDSVNTSEDECSPLDTSSSFVRDVSSDKQHHDGRFKDSKDTKDAREGTQGLSLVQQRLRMFEGGDPGKFEKPEKEEVKLQRGGSDRTDHSEAPGDEEFCAPASREEEPPGTAREAGEPNSGDAAPPESSENLSENEIDADAMPLNSTSQEEEEEEEEAIKAASRVEVELEAPEKEETEFGIVEKNLSTASGIDLSAIGEEIEEKKEEQEEEEEEEEEEEYPEDLNPFNSEEEAEGKDVSKSTNPFDTDEEEEEETKPKPAARSHFSKIEDQQTMRRRLQAPQINLNPFWSDEEEEEDFLSPDKRNSSVPVPKPRTFRQSTETLPKTNLTRGGIYGSDGSNVSSISLNTTSTTPSGGSHRKKKPAPPPPVARDLFHANQSPTISGSSTSPVVSPRTTPRTRKAKPAPPPPMQMPTSTPYNLSPIGAPTSFQEPSEPYRDDIGSELSYCQDEMNVWEDEKNNKDEANRNRQSLSNSSGSDLQQHHHQSYLKATEESPFHPDKSVQGKWKRKKGPAPPRPIPHRRKIKVMSTKEVKLELDEIELQQQGLEKQGVRLEQLIRDKCESGLATDESCASVDVEELVLELFALVNEKNELFRRQAELMLLRRQQRLEEEHADIEYQIRCLMCQPEAMKTDFDKQREELLIQRLVQIVERRNEIVECLEMDRRREIEEDRSIHKQMGLFAAKSKGDLTARDEDSSNTRSIKSVLSVGSKKHKSKEKTKEKRSKKTHKKDIDKDVDETELFKNKRDNKRRWF